MNDDVFNTIAAVALMCAGHFSEIVSDRGIPKDGFYTPGFEQCATVVKTYDEEKARRAKVEEEKHKQAEKDRLANALAAIRGKKFTPEAPPQPSSPARPNSCIVPVNSDILIGVDRVTELK